ncbi:MAG: hypothetical protein R6V85_04095 [Polyangia bacterium]
MAADPRAQKTPCAGEQLIIQRAQLVLAEKRTSLATLRTGIAVFALPLSVLSVLVATSKYYDLFDVLPLLVPLIALCAGLVVLGGYLITRAMVKIRRYDDTLHRITDSHAAVADLIE